MATKAKKKTTRKSQAKKPQLFLSRPQDKSLEAFKEWINEMLQALVGEAGARTDKDEMTEAEWRKAWQEFWKDEKK